MEKERAMILQMVADGKITATQGVELLKALEESERPKNRASQDTGQRSHSRPSIDLPDDLGTTIGNLVESIIGNFGFGFGNGYKFEETFEGSFTPGDESCNIDFATLNGRIAVEAWDRSDYAVKLIKNIRGGSEHEARRKADEMVRVKREPSALSIKMQKGPSLMGGMAIIAYLPKERVYNMELQTANGRVELRGLDTREIKARTANGLVKLEDVNAEKVDASTSNGKVLLRTSASDVRAQSSNGRIVVVPLGTAGGDARYELATSNGSVRMQCSAEPDTGFLLDLHTSNGKIETEMPDLEYELNEKHHGRRSVKAKTRGFDSMSNRIRIQARTSNGKIVVGSPVDWE